MLQVFEVKEREDTEDSVGLGALTYVGATLSIVGILLSIFTLLGAK